MKKLNPNILTFLWAAFLVLSIFSGERLMKLAWCGKAYCLDLLSGSPQAFSDLRERVETAVTDMWYSDQLRSLYSLTENLTGRRLMRKPDMVVVKADSGSVFGLQEGYSEDTIRRLIRRVKGFQQIAEENGAHFLYCQVPAKAMYETLPPNAADNSRLNYERFLKEALDEEIPTLDLDAALRENGLTDHELYFYTDHHWKPSTGFAVTGILCEALRERYGFAYDPFYTDIENYDITVYPNRFLGSVGKKVGAYFSSRGLDDFELIRPSFETDFTEYRLDRGSARSGPFEDTLLYMDNMRYDPYWVNTYVTYSGGDFRLQTITNNLRPQGCRILVIRQSHACVVTPFLAMQTGVLYAVDLREGDYPAGECVDLEAFMAEYRPEYVIVLE